MLRVRVHLSLTVGRKHADFLLRRTAAVPRRALTGIKKYGQKEKLDPPGRLPHADTF
jgi:hypothetical protein